MNKVTLEKFDKAINELPKINDMVSTFSSVSVKELRKAVERFEYVPSFDDLLKENNRLNNIINELEKYIGQEYYCFDNESVEFEVAKNILNKIKELKEGK